MRTALYRIVNIRLEAVAGISSDQTNGSLAVSPARAYDRPVLFYCPWCRSKVG